MQRGRYYLGRVIKLGNLTQENLIESLQKPTPISAGSFQWTFTDAVNESDGKTGYVFSRLSKYTQEGHVTIVDTDTQSQRDAIAENLLVASAPFVYLPEFSGVAYLHVWNGIAEDVFRRRFKTIVEQTFDKFFVQCDIEAIADYTAFVTKLKSMDKFSEIRAKVRPPNPLFGDLWKDLNNYIKTRNASEIQVAEKSSEDDGLSTDLIHFVDAIIEEKMDVLEKSASITDAALLMAADGYGSGKITGSACDDAVVIRTSDTQKSFLFDKEPEPDKLAKEAHKYFSAISRERDMQH